VIEFSQWIMKMQGPLTFTFPLFCLTANVQYHRFIFLLHHWCKFSYQKCCKLALVIAWIWMVRFSVYNFSLILSLLKWCLTFRLCRNYTSSITHSSYITISSFEMFHDSQWRLKFKYFLCRMHSVKMYILMKHI